MYAAKTTELLKRILWARNGEERDVLVVKPAFDNRYSDTRIVTHDGLSVNAYAITRWIDVVKRADFADLIFFDEVQFFDGNNFNDNVCMIIRGLLKTGKTVVVNGLDMDAQGEPFAVTSALIAMADDVVKLRSNCSVCGRPATKTQKLTNTDQQIELGSTGLYEPRCNEHWSPE